VDTHVASERRIAREATRPTKGGGMARVVVGVDGSEQSGRAVRHALREAQLRDATLEVVYAVPDESLMFGEPGMMPPPREDLPALGLELIETVLADVDVGDIEIERTAKIGQVSEVLCDAAEGADLLVVGSRGYGGFRGLMVGSVTQQVVGHATCPILVIVPEDR